MIVTYHEKTNKFLIKCNHNENHLPAALPDRRFRKGTAIWAAPALRRNIEMMNEKFSKDAFDEKALAVLNKKLAEFATPVDQSIVFPSWYKFKNKPMGHQQKALDKHFKQNEAAILFKQGLGKTFTSINLMSAWRMTNQIDAVLVVCPSSIKMVWENELDEHCPIDTQTHAIIAGKSKKALDRFINEKTDFQWLVVGIEGFSQGNAFETVKKFMMTRRVGIIIDESSRIKTPGKIRTNRCIELGKLAYKRLILSGTSITQGIEDLYSQFEFLNEDIIGYSSYYSFRAQFCVTIPVEIAEDKWVDKIVGYKNEDELMNLLRPYCSVVEKEDALDLPPKVYQRRYVKMSPTQAKMYKEMKHELVIEATTSEAEFDYEVDSTLEQRLRLRQITGGHYPWDDGENVIPQPIPGKNPKIEETMALVEEIDGKMLIYCLFKPEISLIAEELEKREIHYVEFHGSCTEEEKRHAVKTFRTDPDTKVFLCTKAAAYGLTLIEATYIIVYSMDESLEILDQLSDRIHRIGTVDTCNYLMLASEKTLDVDTINKVKYKDIVATTTYKMLKDIPEDQNVRTQE